MIPAFTDKDRELIDEWVEKDQLGWPIKKDCPDDVRKYLEKIIDPPVKDNKERR